MTSSHSHRTCVAPGARGDRRCAVSLGHSGSPIYGKSQRCWLGHVISCVQSQLITDHQSTDDQCTLICVAPAMPPVSVHQFQLCAHPCHLPVPHQCHISVPI
ncbi:unnamed protein product [Staurois parvus]|uniref:Uncharacterized protein n=1 Tax=Staurois parvus TaxID=386267 RepID=A0ABN9BRI1_9NEOB|nr:unnamed protein product [Staurois parvus]